MCQSRTTNKKINKQKNQTGEPDEQDHVAQKRGKAFWEEHGSD